MDTGDKQARLREVESTLALLRRELEPPTGEPQDFGDAGADLNAREEHLGMIEKLENERLQILDDLGQN